MISTGGLLRAEVKGPPAKGHFHQRIQLHRRKRAAQKKTNQKLHDASQSKWRKWPDIEDTAPAGLCCLLESSLPSLINRLFNGCKETNPLGSCISSSTIGPPSPVVLCWSLGNCNMTEDLGPHTSSQPAALYQPRQSPSTHSCLTPSLLF